jgi:AcrR family transcriptional regulator
MKQLRSEKTIRAVIDASLKLFVKSGYHGTSISDISKACNLTKGAIYFQFKNKQAILEAILKKFETTLVDGGISEVECLQGNAMDKIRHLLRFSLNLGIQERDLVLCLAHLATELYFSDEEYGVSIKKIYKKYYNLFSKLLKEGIEDGSLRKDIKPVLLTKILVGALEGNSIQWNLNRGKHKGEDYARSFIKFFLNGIRRLE